MKKVLVLIIILSNMMSITLKASVLLDYTDYQLITPLEVLGYDGTLILSNSPETVKEKGILYRENLIGKGRLVFHHVNATGSKESRLVIVVKNITDSIQRFGINKEGYSKPQYHYLEAGNQLLKDYYGCMTSKIFFLKPNEQRVIYDSSSFVWKEQMVLSGMLDVYTSDQLEITFALIGKQDALSELNQLNELAMDAAPRGTFPSLTKYQYVILPQNKKACLLIEDEKQDWVRGRDGLTHKSAVNYGNYGIVYKIKIVAREDRSVFICPRGGIFQGTIRWDNGTTYEIARKHVFKTIKECINIGTIKKDEIRTLEYVLPNGSAAPILIGFDIKE